MKERMINIAVFASGNGSNFSALVAASRKGRLKARIALLVCDNPGAGVLARARRAGVRSVVIERSACKNRADFEARITQQLRRAGIRYLALAGFMRMLSPAFVRRYKNRIVNIHPALLPAFKGAHGLKEAFDYGVKVTGVTVHFVDERMDHGPIILQQALQINSGETLACLEERIHRLEHRLYPAALQRVILKRLRIRGRKVFEG